LANITILEKRTEDLEKKAKAAVESSLVEIRRIYCQIDALDTAFKKQKEEILAYIQLSTLRFAASFEATYSQYQ
jgi:hypothetical protein